MAENFAFVCGVAGVLYVMRWLWTHDDGALYRKPKKFSPTDRRH